MPTLGKRYNKKWGPRSFFFAKRVYYFCVCVEQREEESCANIDIMCTKFHARSLFTNRLTHYSVTQLNSASQEDTGDNEEDDDKQPSAIDATAACMYVCFL